MDIGGIFQFSGARGYKRILTFAIIVMAGLLALAFIRYRLQTRSVEKPDPPAESNATLSINGFEHTATRNGRTSWVLEAATAELYSDENRAALSDVRMRFFTEDQKEIRLTAQKGRFNTKTRNMSVSGSVVCRYAGYVLNTENLHYQHDSNIIYTETQTIVAGRDSRFTADSAEFAVDTRTLTLKGHVNARINEIDKS